MKKVFALFFAMMMLFSLAACGEPTSSAPSSTPSSTPNSDPDPVFTPPADLYELLTSDLLNEMAEKEKGATLSFEMQVQMNVGGTEQSMVVDLTAKVADIVDGTATTMQMQLTVQTPDGPREITAYMQDGFFYVNTDGEKMKVPAEQGEEKPSLDVESLDEDSKALLKAAKVQSGSAGHSYELKLDADTIDSVLQGLGDALPLEGVSFDDITLSITVNPEEKRFELYAQGGMALTMAEASASCTVEMSGSMTFGDVSVQMPSDLDEYPRQLTEEDYQMIYGMLFDAEGNLIENNEIAYNLMCSEYGKEFIDEFIALMQQEG